MNPISIHLSSLQSMHQDGVTLDTAESRLEEGYYVLMTSDPDIARKHGLHLESELWREG